MLKYTALHYAAWRGQAAASNFLLDCLADPNAIGDNGWTPLFLAVHEGHSSVVQRLLEAGSDPNRREEGGDTPLHRAVYQGSVETVELLLQHKATINAITDDGKGDTALHVASRWGKMKLVEVLVKNKANPDFMNMEGRKAAEVAGEACDIRAMLSGDEAAQLDVVDAEARAAEDDGKMDCTVM